MLIALGFLTILLLTVVTGYFVAQEFAYVAVDRGKLQLLAVQGDAAAKRALKVTSKLSFTLSGAQFGITVTALLVGYVSEPLLGEGLAELLGFTGLSEAARLWVSLVFALVFSTAVQMVLGELAPKNLAIARTVPLARALSRSTLIYLAIAGPVIRLFDVASNKLLRSIGIEPVEELPHGASREDLHRIISASRDSGLLDDDVSRLLDRGLAFRDLLAEQVMTPRVDVHTIGADDTLDRVIELLATGNSRFPVLGSQIDEIVGVVGLADVVGVPREQRGQVLVGGVAPPPLLVPTSLGLPAVLDLLRSEHRQLAVVVDEYGGFAGVISFEDIAEEVVGDILDEADHVVGPVILGGEGAWVVSGRIRLDELAEVTGVELPSDEDYETVGGLVLHLLGRIPVAGDIASVEVRLGDRDAADELVAHPADLEVLAVRRHVPSSLAITVVSDR